MKCRRCGAELLDTDTFCVKCGQKVEELPRCPKCGEILREGTKFCHKCGAAVGENDDAIQEPEDDEIPVTGTRTVDIPFDLIEKSIIMEAEQAVVKRDFTNYEKTTQKDDSEAFEEKESEKKAEKIMLMRHTGKAILTKHLTKRIWMKYTLEMKLRNLIN